MKRESFLRKKCKCNNGTLNYTHSKYSTKAVKYVLSYGHVLESQRPVIQH